MSLIIDIFESIVDKSPNTTALILEDKREFSYGSLNNIGLRIAKEIGCAACVIETQSSTNNDETPLVAVMMCRGVGLITAILSILKAGAV